MKIWIVSDLHTNSLAWVPNRVPEHDVMIIAGDVADSPIETILQLHTIARWQSVPIIFVPGNHDVFDADLDFWDGEHKRLVEAGVHVLSSGQSIVIDGVRFIGATLWTDWQINDHEFGAQAWAARHMPEYAHVTRSDGEFIWPIDTSNSHDAHRHAVEQALKQPHEGPTVVITHHAPSARSLHAGEARGEEAGAFASDLEWMISRYRPALWVHGHIHTARDYYVGSRRVICNPRGYESEGWFEQTGWIEDLILEL